jgi:hypothetical protein
MGSRKKRNFVEFINKEYVDFFKRKMNTNLVKIVDIAKLKKTERPPEV